MWYVNGKSEQQQAYSPRIRYDAGSIPVIYYDTGCVQSTTTQQPIEETWQWVRTNNYQQTPPLPRNYGQLSNTWQGYSFPASAAVETANSSRSYVGSCGEAAQQTSYSVEPRQSMAINKPSQSAVAPVVSEMYASAPPAPPPEQEQQHHRYSFSVKPINGDGDCLFTAVADELVRLAQSDRGFATKMAKVLHTENLSRGTIAQRLREACVREWFEKEKYYKEFMSENVDFEAEADRFLRSGYYQSPLGDLAPLTISNMLDVSMNIRTSNNEMPRVKIRPSSLDPDDDNSIHVINLYYTSQGSGHYDVAVPKTRASVTPISIVRY